MNEIDKLLSTIYINGCLDTMKEKENTGKGKELCAKIVAIAKQSLLKEIEKKIEKLYKQSIVNKYSEYEQDYRQYNQALQDCLTNLKRLFE